MALYGNGEYWDQRYTRDPEPFEWYQNYSSLKESIKNAGIQNNHHILMLGCGNSRLSEDMYEDSYKQITNIDSSSVVIKAMQTKYANYPGLVYKEGNVMNMAFFENESFPVLMDKGTLDAILCGDNSSENSQAMLRETSRILQPGGIFFCVSYGQPNYRLPCLQRDDLCWSVKVFTVPKPSCVVSKVLSNNESDTVHYIYKCTKHRSNLDEGSADKKDEISNEPDMPTTNGGTSNTNSSELAS